jgi:hypothetical protein
MSLTVHELRNQIRVRTGRFERKIDATFTKEELTAILSVVGEQSDTDRPSTEEMRAAIRLSVGIESDNDVAKGTFRKAELTAINSALRES